MNSGVTARDPPQSITEPDVKFKVINFIHDTDAVSIVIDPPAGGCKTKKNLNSIPLINPNKSARIRRGRGRATAGRSGPFVLFFLTFDPSVPQILLGNHF